MMKYLYPKNLSSYPLYIFIYWVLIWAVIMLIYLFGIMMSTTPDGKYVQKTDCLKYEKSSSDSACLKYSKPYYTPVGTEIKNTFVKSGIEVGIITMLVGYTLMFLKWSSKKKG